MENIADLRISANKKFSRQVIEPATAPFNIRNCGIDQWFMILHSPYVGIFMKKVVDKKGIWSMMNM